MSDEMDAFSAEWLVKYRKASLALKDFQAQVNGRLKSLLDARTKDDRWGPFKAQKATSRSRDLHSDDPFAAYVDDSNTAIQVYAKVVWDKHELVRPYGLVRVKKGTGKDSREEFKRLTEAMGAYGWARKVEAVPSKDGIRLDPTPDDFDLDRDFNILLDELVRFMTDHAERPPESGDAL